MEQLSEGQLWENIESEMKKQIDARKRKEIISLLQSFSVKSAIELKTSQFADFLHQLKNL